MNLPHLTKRSHICGIVVLQHQIRKVVTTREQHKVNRWAAFRNTPAAGVQMNITVSIDSGVTWTLNSALVG